MSRGRIFGEKGIAPQSRPHLFGSAPAKKIRPRSARRHRGEVKTKGDPGGGGFRLVDPAQIRELTSCTRAAMFVSPTISASSSRLRRAAMILGKAVVFPARSNKGAATSALAIFRKASCILGARMRKVADSAWFHAFFACARSTLSPASRESQKYHCHCC